MPVGFNRVVYCLANTLDVGIEAQRVIEEIMRSDTSQNAPVAPVVELSRLCRQ